MGSFADRFVGRLLMPAGSGFPILPVTAEAPHAMRRERRREGALQEISGGKIGPS
jgi:hypothetical protein